jgi:hypothetical protein
MVYHFWDFKMVLTIEISLGRIFVCSLCLLLLYVCYSVCKFVQPLEASSQAERTESTEIGEDANTGGVTSIFDSDLSNIYDQGFADGRVYGFEIGRKEGFEDGVLKGFEEGRQTFLRFSIHDIIRERERLNSVAFNLKLLQEKSAQVKEDGSVKHGGAPQHNPKRTGSKKKLWGIGKMLGSRSKEQQDNGSEKEEHMVREQQNDPLEKAPKYVEGEEKEGLAASQTCSK